MIILIVSTDELTWTRYKQYQWASMKEAEFGMSEDFNEVYLSAKEDNMLDSHYFQLVGLDYFNQFQKPYC